MQYAVYICVYKANKRCSKRKDEKGHISFKCRRGSFPPWITAERSARCQTAAASREPSLEVVTVDFAAGGTRRLEACRQVAAAAASYLAIASCCSSAGARCA